MLGCWCRAQSYKRHEHHKSPSAAQVSCTWLWFCQRCFLTSHLCVWVCVFGCSCVSGFVCQLSDEDNGLISVLALAPLCCVVTTCHYQKHRRWHTSVPELTSIQACKKQPPLQTHLKTHVLLPHLSLTSPHGSASMPMSHTCLQWKIPLITSVCDFSRCNITAVWQLGSVCCRADAKLGLPF